MNSYIEFGMLIATGMDYIDQHECSETSIAAIISGLLEHMGHKDKVVVYAVAVGVVKAIQADFIKLYWEDGSAGAKIKAISAAVETAEMSIKEGKIDENIRRAASKMVAKESQDGV